jgi:hypothetical protein
MRSLLAGGVIAFALATTAAASPRNDFTVVMKERAGPYRYIEALNRGRSYGAAIAAFGTPSNRGSEFNSNLCTLRWASIGIDIHFASRLKPCARGHVTRSAWYGMRLWDPRWHTLKGLRVGDPVARVRKLYPRATLHTKPPQLPSYWLATWRLEPDAPLSPLLEAQLSGGRVSALVVHAGYVY